MSIYSITKITFCGFIAIIVCVLFLNITFSADKPTILYIANKSSLMDVASHLESNGVIKNRIIFVLMAKYKQIMNKSYLKSGEYEFLAGETMFSIIDKMQKAVRYKRKILIIEGLTIFEIENIINNAEGLLGNADGMLHECNVMPDTYYYYYGDKKVDIVKSMVDAQKQYLASLKIDDAKFHEVLTLASIIEREAKLTKEMAVISAVYHKRLKIRMPLQADPTVIYSITEGKSNSMNRRLVHEDLKVKSQYNTYSIKGLPPTPIGCPGRLSIYAAAYPEVNNFFYFVADGFGGHYFAQNYSQHLDNIKKTMSQH